MLKNDGNYGYHKNDDMEHGWHLKKAVVLGGGGAICKQNDLHYSLDCLTKKVGGCRDHGISKVMR